MTCYLKELRKGFSFISLRGVKKSKSPTLRESRLTSSHDASWWFCLTRIGGFLKILLIDICWRLWWLIFLAIGNQLKRKNVPNHNYVCIYVKYGLLPFSL